MKRAYADIPEGQMHYRTEGSGEVILLLHMAVNSSDEYARVIPYLSKRYRVIAPDYMGHGESDRPPEPYQIGDHARSIVHFMDALGIERASLGGHHAGAMIGLEIAVTRPERVDKLIMSCIPYWREDSERAKSSRDPNFQQVEIDPEGGHLLEWWRRAKRYGDPVDIVEERVLCMHKAGPRGEELHWAINAYATRLREVLPTVRCPTLVLAPTRDHLAPVQEDVHRLIPGSKLVPIEGGPVYVDRVMPREFAEPILAFLENP